jgi:integrase
VREERRWIPLETHDRDLAKRKMAKIVDMLARGELVADAAPAEAKRVSTVTEAIRDYCERRKTAGVAMASSELGYAEHHIIPQIGPMLVTDVKKVHIKSTLRVANEKGKAKGMIAHLRRFLFRFFKSLEVDEIIPANPVRLVALADVGRMKQDRRPFTLPTDEEISLVFASPAVDVEIKLVILVARTLGGARAAEVNRWTWPMVDRDGFAACVLQRAKGDDVQDFLIPEALRPFLRAWWEGHGCPSAGPVFPVARGRRRGEARGKSAYAARVRRAFWNAGIRRTELHEDTATSRRLNFHSTGRRAFASALARSGINEQTAMTLTHHADSRTHRRYVQQQIREVPAAALPALGAITADGWASTIAKRTGRALPVVDLVETANGGA